MIRYIRITATPAGAAPDWVREKWVGLELPLVLKQDKRKKTYQGAVPKPGFFASLKLLLSGKKDRREGYAVPTLAAIAILGQKNPDAAAWWKENAQHLIGPKRYFLFRTDCCHLLGEDKTF